MVRDEFARLSEKRIMLNTLQQRTTRAGDGVFAASRQLWLAGLGAAVVTRDWARHEAAGVFRTLVNEGAAVESRAVRRVGEQVEASAAKANLVWNQTRATVESAVRAYTDTVMTIVQPAPAAKGRNVTRAQKSNAATTRKRSKKRSAKR